MIGRGLVVVCGYAMWLLGRHNEVPKVNKLHKYDQTIFSSRLNFFLLPIFDRLTSAAFFNELT